jgi:hypothetical protein
MQRWSVALFWLKLNLYGGRYVSHGPELRKRVANLFLKSTIVSYAVLDHGVVPPSDCSVKVETRGFCPRENNLSG